MNNTDRLIIYLIPILSQPMVVKSQGLYNDANLIVVGQAGITMQDGGFHNKGVFAPGTGTVSVIPENELNFIKVKTPVPTGHLLE